MLFVKASDSASEELSDVQRTITANPWHEDNAAGSPESRRCCRSAGGSWRGGGGNDAGFGCISEKHTICTCHWVDNPKICRIEVNLSLKNEMDWEHIKTQYLRPGVRVFCRRSTFGRRVKVMRAYWSPDVKPVWILLQHRRSSLTFLFADFSFAW